MGLRGTRGIDIGYALVALAALAVTLALTATASARAPHRGVMLHSLWWDSDLATMDRELDLSAQAGATAVRVDLSWANIEWKGKGTQTSYVEKLDRFFEGAAARGMRVIADLWATPCWASTAPDDIKRGCTDEVAYWEAGGPTYGPSNVADYADIARWVTARYGDKLAGLEVWNEPNHGAEFWKGSARDYAELVKAAYPAAKAGSPGVAVLAGALAGSDRDYLQELYAAGIRGSYDGIAVHPYADPGLAQLDAFRAAQAAAGDTTPVWITEFGWPTGSTGWHVTESEQATEISKGYADADRRDWIAAALLYGLRDKGNNPASMQDNFGVLRRDFTPKAGFAALRAGLTGAASPAPASEQITRSTVSDTLAPARGAKSAAPKRSAKRVRGKWVKVRMWLRVIRGRVVAIGRAPAGRKIVVIVKQRRRKGRGRSVATSARRRVVRVDRRGRFRVNLGARRRLRGHVVKASLLRR